jgi:hypothetical protein
MKRKKPALLQHRKEWSQTLAQELLFPAKAGRGGQMGRPAQSFRLLRNKS